MTYSTAIFPIYFELVYAAVWAFLVKADLSEKLICATVDHNLEII